jgi:surface protein
MNITQVTNIERMFYDCYDLISVDLSNIYTDNVTSMKRMFSYCNNLNYLNLGNGFDVSSVTDMSYMFDNCESLKELDLNKTLNKNLYAPKLTNM